MHAHEAIQPDEHQLRAATRLGVPWQYWAPPGRPGRLVQDLLAVEFSSTGSPAVPERTYRERVSVALAAIKAGKVEKVVLARAEHLPPADPVGTLLALRRRFPECWVFAISDGEQTFLGATPELLLRIRGQRLETCALAGTADPGDDSLLSSTKDLHEHRLVVDAIADALAPLCEAVYPAPKPELLRLANVQHLRTPISGVLREGVTPREVVEALHPTPAVCGTPREAARRLIGELEPFDRGLYTGVLGWIDGDEAELVVALRCALLTNEASILYAGAGIVAGSDPAAEERETQAKLSAVADALRYR